MTSVTARFTPDKKFSNSNSSSSSSNNSKNSSPSKDSSSTTCSKKKLQPSRLSSEDESTYEKIINNLTSNYNLVYNNQQEQESEPKDDDDNDNDNKYEEIPLSLTKTIEHLRENIRPGICLICIDDIEKVDSIWSCRNCYCSLHLICIQRWAKDSIANVREAIAYKGFNLPLVWCCPKCREEYLELEVPFKYKCFCGKIENPKVDPWIAPHSCGEICGKQLLPECGHTCVLLCHAGACPPCPKQVSSTCFCTKSPPKTLRCFIKSWSCSKPCSKLLKCEFHHCTEICHDSSCPSCKVPITINCKCSKPKPITIPCQELIDNKSTIVTCGESCKKLLNCGIHTCMEICHDGLCKSCKQSCPCGKRQVDCIGITGSNLILEKCCEDTCGKILDCNQHNCAQKCHLGSCGSCLAWVEKICKCGSLQKEISCSKELTCNIKCKKIRDCGIHPCNKKCCEGNCPPCRNVCNKTLNCKNHKCESICHRGPCYPCPAIATVKCRCGQTIRTVPCGSERKCKPPMCSLLCQLKTKCDHLSIQKHKCHFGDCPRCMLQCGKQLSCGHNCPAICHSYKLNKKPCPDCKELVPSECTLHAGNNILVECRNKNKPCEEICKKLLTCGFHYCQKRCHERLGTNCGECNSPCSQPRPAGCEHECSLGCHAGPCPQCTLVSRVPCHCEGELLYIICSRQQTLTESERSCKNQCPKKLSCGHRCLSICHNGECNETERCRRKVKQFCKCKHHKKEIECFLVDKDASKVLPCVPPFCVGASPKAGGGPNSPGSGEGSTTNPNKKKRKKKTSESSDKTTENSEQNGSIGNEDGNIDNNTKNVLLGIPKQWFMVASATIILIFGVLTYFGINIY